MRPSFPAGARLPGLLPGVLWRADMLDAAEGCTWATGFAALDAALPGGGWPCGGLVELLPVAEGCAWRLLQPALERWLLQPGARLALVGCPQAPHALFPRSLAAMDAVLWVQAHTDAERLWATEQLLRAHSAATAMVAWLPHARPPQLRRLQVQALSARGLAFLLRPPAAAYDPSAAPLRLGVAAADGGRLAVQVLKRRGPTLDEPIVVRAWPPALAALLPDAAEPAAATDPTAPALAAASGGPAARQPGPASAWRASPRAAGAPSRSAIPPASAPAWRLGASAAGRPLPEAPGLLGVPETMPLFPCDAGPGSVPPAPLQARGASRMRPQPAPEPTGNGTAARRPAPSGLVPAR